MTIFPLAANGGCCPMTDRLENRLSPRISGAAQESEVTIRIWLRGLRCMRLLDGDLHKQY
jgi:hypothetical protein